MLNDRLAQYGRWTYRGAWALEIVAAAISLATGIALGWQAFTGSTSATAVDLVLASAPFLMVALAELTKIPIATLMFASSLVWKPILAVALAALAFITFETVLTGLERAFTLRQLEYKDLVDRIHLATEDKKVLEDQLRRLEDPTAANAAQSDVERMRSEWEAQRQSTLRRIAEVETEIQGTDLMPPAYADLKRQIETAEADLAALRQQQETEITQRGAEFESQRDSYAGRYEEHLILDNYAAHKHPKVWAWLERHPRFVFHCTPTSCSWLNAVETFFSKLTRRRLKRGVFCSVVELQAAINRFVAETNEMPTPFTWTANPDKIIAAVRRGHQLLGSIGPWCNRI